MPSRVRPELAACAIITAVMLCTGALLARPAGDAPPLAAALPRLDGDARDYDAYLVVQADDCASSLKMLTLFERPPVKARVGLAQLLLVGTAGDLVRARRLLGGTGTGAPIRLADERVRRALGAVGYRATPFVVVTDRSGAVKLTAQAPATPEEYVAFGHLFASLAAREPGQEARP
jgi:hypothetical protein